MLWNKNNRTPSGKLSQHVVESVHSLDVHHSVRKVLTQKLHRYGLWDLILWGCLKLCGCLKRIPNMCQHVVPQMRPPSRAPKSAPGIPGLPNKNMRTALSRPVQKRSTAPYRGHQGWATWGPLGTWKLTILWIHEYSVYIIFMYT